MALGTWADNASGMEMQMGHDKRPRCIPKTLLVTMRYVACMELETTCDWRLEGGICGAPCSPRPSKVPTNPKTLQSLA